MLPHALLTYESPSSPPQWLIFLRWVEQMHDPENDEVFEQITGRMVRLGRRRSLKHRIVRGVVFTAAITFAALILWQIYVQTQTQNLDWPTS